MDGKMISDRIEKLEARCVLLSWLGITLFGILLGAYFFVRFQHPKSLYASEFLLRNSNGKIVARLSNEHGETCLRLNGENKSAVAELCVDDYYGSSLMLNDEKRRSRAFLSAGSKLADGRDSMGPGLVIAERDGENVVTFMAGKETKLLVGHGNEESSLILTFPEGKPRINITGDSGKAVWSAP